MTNWGTRALNEQPDSSTPLPMPVGSDNPDLPRPNHGEPELAILANPDEVARAAAARIADALVSAVESRDRADFCTTGGSSPIPIYRLLSEPAMCDRIPWSRVHVWFGDDRFVPRGHPESNVTPLDDVLLGGGVDADRPPLPAANVHPFPVSRALAEGRDQAWCAAAYAAEIAAQLSIGPGNWPVFDLILVGVGPDGHLLSCFRDSPAFESLDWTMVISAPTHIGPHLPRVTLNPRLLEASPVLVVTWGSSKAATLGHVFGEVRDEHRWPAQRTRRPGATWLIDRAAATAIPSHRSW